MNGFTLRKRGWEGASLHPLRLWGDPDWPAFLSNGIVRGDPRQCVFTFLLVQDF